MKLLRYRDGKNIVPGILDDGNKAFDTCVYNKSEIERIAVLAFDEALKRNKKLTLVDKANVLSTSRLWREVIQNISKNYSNVKVDYLFVSEIYPAGEQPIKNINSSKLVKDIIKKGGKNIIYLPKLKKLESVLSPFFVKENLIIFMGAGSISQWAYELMERLSVK